MLVKIEKKKVADYWHNVREQFKGKYDVGDCEQSFS